jgi:hypothetical protein
MQTVLEPLRDAWASFVEFLPSLVAGLVVFLIGWLIAALLRRVVDALLRRTGFDRFLARHRMIDRPPEAHTGTHVVASVVFWAVILIALMQAANIWGLDFVANGLGAVIAYLPNIIAAALIFGVALLLGNWVRDRMRSRAIEERWQTTFLPGATRAAILTIGAFLALRQLEIATEILIIAFALVFGAIALATAIAFGLGGRHTVARLTQDWYERQRTRRGPPGPRPEAGAGAYGRT